VAADFFDVGVWTRGGLQRFMVLFLIELPARNIQIASIAGDANGLWLSQIGRNLKDSGEGAVAVCTQHRGIVRGAIRCRERLGGVLNHHYRATA